MSIADPESVRCPTCGARQPWSDACRRCKSDLRLLRAAADDLAAARRRCLEHLNAGRPAAALESARRAHELRPDADSARLVAACALAAGDWATAVALARDGS